MTKLVAELGLFDVVKDIFDGEIIESRVQWYDETNEVLWLLDGTALSIGKFYAIEVTS